MGLLDKLFRSKSKSTNPDNSRLFELLNTYQKAIGNSNSYSNVVSELMHGNSFLLLPSVNEKQNSDAWTTTTKDTSLQLTCIYDLDGLKVLGAFTDETNLLNWAKKPTQYTGLSSQDVLKICEENLVDRIVINRDSPTMFVLERNRENIKTETIEKDTPVQVGTPNRPLENKIIQKLIEQFKRVETIEEVYQYGQTKNNEFSVVLGFKLYKNSDNAKTAAINAVQKALEGEKLDQHLDLFFIQDQSWYKTITNVENSFMYKREQ